MAEKLATPVFTVFWRKRWHSGSARRYVTCGGGTGFTERWQNANRYATRREAEIVAQRMETLRGEQFEVVEETRPLPAPTPRNGTMGLHPGTGDLFPPVSAPACAECGVTLNLIRCDVCGRSFCELAPPPRTPCYMWHVFECFEKEPTS